MDGRQSKRGKRNESTLTRSIEVVGRDMLDILAPSPGCQSYGSVMIDREPRVTGRRQYASHNIGRWWAAMRRLAAATGFVVSAEIEVALRRNRADDCANPPCVVCLLLRAANRRVGSSRAARRATVRKYVKPWGFVSPAGGQETSGETVTVTRTLGYAGTDKGTQSHNRDWS